MELALLPELRVTSLFGLIWLLEVIFIHVLRASPLIGHIVAGVLVGPALSNIIPHVESFRLLGKLGVMLLVIESGLSVDIEQVKKNGVRAFLAALSGVILPVLLTMLILTVFWGQNWKEGLSAGAAIAPTSLGFSAQLLSEVHQLSTPVGQLICTAAVVDDVLSLLLLSEIKAFQGDTIVFWDIIHPVLASLGSIIVGCGLCLMCVPYLKKVRVLVPDSSRRATLYMVLLFFCAVLFAWASAILGSSDLLGCFFAGLIFSTESEVLEVWNVLLSQIVRWGSALFFAATIGFGIPSLVESGGLFEINAFLRGVSLSVAAILGKFIVGFYGNPLNVVNFMKLAWAMNGRGEFSFLIADQAAREGLLNITNYSAVIWALLLSSFVAPFGFRFYLNKDVDSEMTLDANNISVTPSHTNQQDTSTSQEKYNCINQ